MSTLQLLETYISEHPDYWEFENERNEVERLKKLCAVQVTD
ncbi:MAG: hypothetical protein QNL61_06170 [Crocinitomicaceae bacterium]|jgi:hypothetical protein